MARTALPPCASKVPHYHLFRSADLNHLSIRQDLKGIPYGGTDLVCGQGRLEAYKALGQAEIHACVIEATQEELLLMNLTENLARRVRSSADLMKGITVLKEAGHAPVDLLIATFHRRARGIRRHFRGASKVMYRRLCCDVPARIWGGIWDKQTNRFIHTR